MAFPASYNRLKTRTVLTLLIIVSFTACVEEYWPELNQKYISVLVVDGMITNEPGPYTIYLSSSSTVANPYLTPLNGYQVVIIDDQGNEELLNQTEKGTYQTSPTGIRGMVGRQYKLIIKDPSGRTYESAFAELKEPAVIKSVYAELEYRQYDHLYYDQAGYQFYVDTYRAAEDTSYFLWRLTETYKYNADYYIRWKYGPRFERVYNLDTLYTCWKTENIKQIFTYSTQALDEPVISHYPLHYITTDTRHLSIRYSLSVQQFTLGEEAHNFWSMLKEQQEQEGMFTKQPFQIAGNISNIDNPDEVVLGYFTVAGISEQRIFMDRPHGIYFHYFKCHLGPADYDAMAWLYMAPSSSWPYYITEDANYAKAFPHQDCIDCTRKGGVLEPPEFWTDH